MPSLHRTLAIALVTVNLSVFPIGPANAFDKATFEACNELGKEMKKFAFLRNETRMRQIEQQLMQANLINTNDMVAVKDNRVVMGMSWCGMIASRGLPWEIGIVNGRRGEPPFMVMSYANLQSNDGNDVFTVKNGIIVGWRAREGLTESGRFKINQQGEVYRGQVDEVIYRYSPF